MWSDWALPIACQALLVVFAPAPASAAEGPKPTVAQHHILTPRQWKRVDGAVDRALSWLARQQQPDGSFPTRDVGQPGVSSLCVMAFLARGHVPGAGPYGRQIDAGINFVLSCQKGDGLLAKVAPASRSTGRPGYTALYNHAIAGLLLTEVYGMTGDKRPDRIHKAIESAIAYSRRIQTARKRIRVDRGGWRYLVTHGPIDSDLSVTAWQLMCYRSAKNAGFSVPEEYVSEAMQYVERCFDEREGTFLYGLVAEYRHISRAMAGAGILSLALGGKHDTPMARAAGEWVLRHPFDRYNRGPRVEDRYHYGAYYCSQAMFQLGGRYWREFYPRLLKPLLANQSPEGSWQAESNADRAYGNAYTTALTVLALCTPYQLLPIYQR